jgi:hypothetical protein
MSAIWQNIKITIQKNEKQGALNDNWSPLEVFAMVGLVVVLSAIHMRFV